MEFKTDFVTYKGVYRSIMTEKLNVPTSDGRRTILSNHMPIIMPLEMGVIETLEDGKLRHYAVNNGVMYFRDNVAEVVADLILDVREIDRELALQDKKEAEDNIGNAKREYEKIRYKQHIEVAENLLKVLDRYPDEK